MTKDNVKSDTTKSISNASTQQSSSQKQKLSSFRLQSENREISYSIRKNVDSGAIVGIQSSDNKNNEKYIKNNK